MHELHKILNKKVCIEYIISFQMFILDSWWLCYYFYFIVETQAMMQK